MTDISTGDTPGERGHTRSTWRDENHLRGLLMRVRREHPDADRDELLDFYLAEAKGPNFSASPQNEAFIDEALKRAFDNDYGRVRHYERLRATPVLRPTRPQVESVPARASQAESVRQSARVVPRRRVTDADIAAVGQRLRAIVLLDLPEANGKKLGDCTAGELRALGGWRINIADRIGDDTAIVRERISEAEAVQIRDSSIAQG